MPFWDDLSSGVKLYVIVAVVLCAAIFGFRHCGGEPGTAAPTQSRGGR